MQTSKTKNGSSEVPHKTSPIKPTSSQVSKTTRSESDSANSKLAPTNSSNERSPKIIDRRSPKCSVIEKRRPIRSSELQSQATQLQEELRKMKEHLCSCESSKQQLQQEADESKKQLADKSAKLAESQLQLFVLSTAEDDRLQELRRILQERDKVWRSKLEALQKQCLADSAALLSAMNEIQSLKQQLNRMKSETAQAEDSKLKKSESKTLTEEMAETLSTIENLEIHNREGGLAETAANCIVSETLKQLEIANDTIETLHADSCNLLESLSSVNSKLEESKVRVSALEEIAAEYQKVVDDNEVERRNAQRIECRASQLELKRLAAALKAAEAKYHEEQIRMKIQIRSACETAELVKFNAGLRESELESTIEKTKIELSELKERLLDMEKEVHRISEMNKELREEMEKGEDNRFDSELKLMKATTDVTELKANLLDKEAALQRILEENGILNSELSKRDHEHQIQYTAAIADAEKARAAEKEALKRTGLVEGEAEKSSKRGVMVLQQLEEAKAANLEMEAELRRLKVQSGQWRKAAEAASAILTPGNNGRIIEDSDSNSISGKLTSSPFADDLDDASPKKNSSVLRKLGGLWKKSPKSFNYRKQAEDAEHVLQGFGNF